EAPPASNALPPLSKMPKAAAVVSGWPVDTPPEGPIRAGRKADPAGWRSCVGTCVVLVSAKATTRPAAPRTSARQLPLMVHLAMSHGFDCVRPQRCVDDLDCSRVRWMIPASSPRGASLTACSEPARPMPRKNVPPRFFAGLTIPISDHVLGVDARH